MTKCDFVLHELSLLISVVTLNMQITWIRLCVDVHKNVALMNLLDDAEG